MFQDMLVYAYNGYDWSLQALPSPISMVGTIKAPGAPVNIQAYPTSAVGIQVTWSPPNGDACVYGGNGGSPISYYVIEWDQRQDFSSPADSVTIMEGEGFTYEIGGRNYTTGKVSQVLESGGTYYIRITAFNSKGAGVAGYLSLPVTLTDQLPYVPGDIKLDRLSSTSLTASWASPTHDGGGTLEKYRLDLSSNASFASFTSTDFPVTHEVQTLVAEADTTIEIQKIRVLADVTNEQQVIRTNIIGVDEVQSVSTHTDYVTNEIQRVVTSADDIDEIQTVEILGTEVHEIQVIQSYSPDDPEIQQIDISSNVVQSVQKFGVYIKNVDTSSCSVGSNCSTIENSISGMIKLYWNPNECGGGAYADDNWCYRALVDDGFGDVGCGTNPEQCTRSRQEQ